MQMIKTEEKIIELQVHLNLRWNPVSLIKSIRLTEREVTYKHNADVGDTVTQK